MVERIFDRRRQVRGFMGSLRTWLRDFDLTLFGTMVLLIVIGIVTIYCAAYQFDAGVARPYYRRQAAWFLLGLVLMLPVMVIDYRTLARLAWPAYGVTTVLLMVVMLVGESGGGAQRWIGLRAVRLQPSELMKLSLLFVFAALLDRQRERIQQWPVLLSALFVALIPVLLIARQPDLGTALALLPMLAVLLYIGGAARRHLALLSGLGLSLLPLAWYGLKDYQKERVLAFVDPTRDPLGASYQLIQSRIAVGSGQWFGKGWLGGTQTQLNFLPVQHTDFIFSVYAEQWGFVGSVFLLTLYVVLITRAISIATAGRDLLGSLLCMGVVTLVAFQVLVNLGMTVGLMPVTGLPLPFLSYGGSSLVTFMIGVALILNVRLRQDVF